MDPRGPVQVDERPLRLRLQLPFRQPHRGGRTARIIKQEQREPAPEGENRMERENDAVDVIVIGAGLSGLVAARRLDQAGVTSLRVLEARDRVGGRTKLHTLENGRVVEEGGQLVGPEYKRLIALGEELDVSTWPHFEQG